MANIIINGTTYTGVPSIQSPKQGGGNAVFYDTTDATAAAANILSGYTAYGASGKVSGTLTVPTITQDASTHVLTIS